MNLEELNKEYDKLQEKDGAKELSAIYNGGCLKHPDFCFVFMNPTGKNPASSKTWEGIRAPWLGTKNSWDLFFSLNLLSEDIYKEIKIRKGQEWDVKFAKRVYEDVEKHKVFITNLGKCTQIDARPLPDSIYKKYLKLLFREIEIVAPKIILLFGNQVSSLILKEKIAVSKVRRKEFIKEINKKSIPFIQYFILLEMEGLI